jgi:carbonic anhydrase
MQVQTEGDRNATRCPSVQSGTVLFRARRTRCWLLPWKLGAEKGHAYNPRVYFPGPARGRKAEPCSMLPRSLGTAARRLGLAAAPARSRACSASAARRPCPPSDGGEAGEDGLPPTSHGPEPEERRRPRRGEHR